jgi:iron complex outermembrane receptor protein
MWQIDVSMIANYGCFRGGGRGYYSWIEDYITLDYLDADGSVLYAYLNTDLATLSGFEFFGEFDANPYVTLFSQTSYVEGRDHTRSDTVSTQRILLSPIFNLDPNLRSGATTEEDPLPVIPPLESRLGVRLHDPCQNPLWAVEFSARVVNHQDRFANSLLEQATPGFTTYDIMSYWQLCSDFLFTAGVQNLTDKQYQNHFDTKRRGRSADVFVFEPGISFYFGGELTY